MITCCDAQGNSYDDQTGISIPGSTYNPAGSSAYTDVSGASVPDSGSGSALSSILKSLAAVVPASIYAAVGPQNRGMAVAAPYGYGPNGLPLSAPAQTGTMTIVFLLVVALVGLFVWKKL